MTEYGGSHSKGRNVLKSPKAHNQDDPRMLRKKCDTLKESLENTQRQLEECKQLIQTQKELLLQQSREMKKKDDINDILMDQIKMLKGNLNLLQTTHGKHNSNSADTSEEKEDNKMVGGYFGSVFK